MQLFITSNPIVSVLCSERLSVIVSVDAGNYPFETDIALSGQFPIAESDWDGDSYFGISVPSVPICLRQSRGIGCRN